LTLGFAVEKTATPSNPVTVYLKCSANALASGPVISVTAFKGNNSVATTSFTNYTLPDGTVYLATTLTSNFTSVKISLLGGGSDGVRVYYAFYSNNPSNTSNPYPYTVADCGLPNVTTTSITGLTVLGSTAIRNPERAIDLDANASTYSTFNIGALSALAVLKQTYHFNGDSNVGDGIRIVLGYGSSTLNVQLLSGINVQAYRGNVTYGSSVTINSLLTLGLGGLIANSNKFEIYFIPNKPNATDGFDRVEVVLNAAVVLTDGEALQVYDVRRIPQMPVAQDVTTCENLGVINLAALSNQESILANNLIFNWYDQSLGGLSKAIGKEFTITDLLVPSTKEYYVDVTKSGCATTSPSPRKKTSLTILQAPITPPISLTP
jgi:hypothetical protein